MYVCTATRVYSAFVILGYLFGTLSNIVFPTFFKSLYEYGSWSERKLVGMIVITKGTELGHNDNNTALRANNGKILCVLDATSKQYKQLHHSLNTWVKRCSSHAIVTDWRKEWERNITPDFVFPPGLNLWERTRESWRYIHSRHRHKYDLYLLTSVWTHVDVRAIVRYTKGIKGPFVLGNMILTNGELSPSLAPALVTNSDTIARFAQVMDSNLGDCKWLRRPRFPVAFAKCMKYIKAQLIDARDSSNRFLFPPAPIQLHVLINNRVQVREAKHFLQAYPMEQLCFSRHAIVLTVNSGEDILFIEYFTQHFTLVYRSKSGFTFKKEVEQTTTVPTTRKTFSQTRKNSNQNHTKT